MAADSLELAQRPPDAEGVFRHKRRVLMLECVNREKSPMAGEGRIGLNGSSTPLPGIGASP
jgi:hypothetical protein